MNALLNACHNVEHRPGKKAFVENGKTLTACARESSRYSGFKFVVLGSAVHANPDTLPRATKSVVASPLPPSGGRCRMQIIICRSELMSCKHVLVDLQLVEKSLRTDPLVEKSLTYSS